ncbi:hypothetical protein EVAR_35665_1 [Eumeta japonica]|uniref:Uncharacterized protein n=1 Tax=Eumeta variegata TaxID=151549 RepID=A0A4C1VFY4_EUMVA|nr:hypothetical protein EVAR_35665_1 [Eumeta japonica]
METESEEMSVDGSRTEARLSFSIESLLSDKFERSKGKDDTVNRCDTDDSTANKASGSELNSDAEDDSASVASNEHVDVENGDDVAAGCRNDYSQSAWALAPPAPGVNLALVNKYVLIPRRSRKNGTEVLPKDIRPLNYVGMTMFGTKLKTIRAVILSSIMTDVDSLLWPDLIRNLLFGVSIMARCAKTDTAGEMAKKKLLYRLISQASRTGPRPRRNVDVRRRWLSVPFAALRVYLHSKRMNTVEWKIQIGVQNWTGIEIENVDLNLLRVKRAVVKSLHLRLHENRRHDRDWNVQRAEPRAGDEGRQGSFGRPEIIESMYSMFTWAEPWAVDVLVVV